MVIRNNELLDEYTAIKFDVIAIKYYIPEHVLELQKLLKNERGLYFGGGQRAYSLLSTDLKRQ